MEPAKPAENAEAQIEFKPIEAVAISSGTKVEDRERLRVQRALTRWMDEAERESQVAWEDGRCGYIGQFKLEAFSDDAGIKLRVERAFTEEL